MSTCRSCGAEIIWAVTENGKRMPLDVEPVKRPTGLFRLEPGRPSAGGEIVALAQQVEWDGPYHVSHFATCPNAAQHRKT